jgi:DNA-binding MarR family transcriptional regulator
MDEEIPWADQIPLPALLRHARTVYGSAIRKALAEAGYDDVPRNGLYVIGAIALTGAPLGRIITDLGVSKQAASQLVDSLVLRGYLDRTVDAEDRRRLVITLSRRGEAAAAVSRSVVARLDAALVARAGSEDVARTRRTLAIIIDELGEAEDGGEDAAD